MNIDCALVLFSAMPFSERRAVLIDSGLDEPTVATLTNGCPCWRCTKHRRLFISAVSAKADAIERAMLAEQKVEGIA